MALTRTYIKVKMRQSSENCMFNWQFDKKKFFVLYFADKNTISCSYEQAIVI